MLRDMTIDGSVFRGSLSEVDYASFLAWHDWGRPEDTVQRIALRQSALRAADGAFLSASCRRQTANEGHIYFPSGTPDRTTSSARTSIFDGNVVA